MGKKSQNWSLEVIIALSVFLVIFILVSVFLYYVPEDETRNLRLSSTKVTSALENDLLIDDDEVKDSGITELANYTCEELKDLFAISGDVCIHFENLDGYVVEVDGQLGIGCEELVFNNGTVCGK